MIPILSQLHTVPSEFFLYWVIVALVGLGVIVALVTVWSNVRQRPPHESPTRREFDDLKGKVTHIENTLPEMERRILGGVRDASKELSAKMEKVSAADHESRTELWDRFNKENKEIGERVATVEAKVAAKKL